MQTYTLCDLDNNNQTRCYTDCRYQSSPFDHTHTHVTAAAWSSIDDTSAYDSAFVDDEFWQLCDTERIATVSTSGHYPLDVTYYFRCPNYEYCYADDSVSHENWISGCQTFYADSECLDGSWGSIRDDVTLDSRYLSLYEGAGLECMEMFSAGRRQPSWNDSEDYQRTDSHRSTSGNHNNLMRGVETFKWMTLKRGSTKCAQTGLYWPTLCFISYSLYCNTHETDMTCS